MPSTASPTAPRLMPPATRPTPSPTAPRLTPPATRPTPSPTAARLTPPAAPRTPPRRALPTALLATLLSLAACSRPTPAPGPLSSRLPITLPNGAQLTAEVMVRPEDMARGMMFRDALPPNQAMLFIHDHPARYTYWMHNVRVPLDIIWMDRDHRIVELSEATPPCLADASQCPSFGGNADAMFVLELAAGQAARHALKTGDRIGF